jgi:hypothetical protein
MMKTIMHRESYIFWDVSRVLRQNSTDVSEEHVVSIFRVEEKFKDEAA